MKNDSAFPIPNYACSTEQQFNGLTKRELFAAMALQGLLAGGAFFHESERNAIYAYAHADALIKQLEATSGEGE